MAPTGPVQNRGFLLLRAGFTLMTSAPRLGEHPLVTTYIASIIKQDILDRNRPGVRYDDTWDATLTFDY
jgi:hypothetical protein